MTILITGATGLVGKSLVALLRKENHTIHYLTTSKKKILNHLNYKGFYWNPKKGEIDKAAFDSVEVIIHLAGASIAKKWTNKYKKEIIESRVNSANLLYNVLNEIPNNVSRFISASAIGIYPNSLTEVYHENSAYVNSEFIGNVTQLWEESANKFRKLNILVSIVRIGVVLSNRSGALVDMAKPIKFGVGAALGSGNQFVSWIDVHDLVAVFNHILVNKLNGVYNAVAPYPVTNYELTKAIAKALRKPLFLPNIPTFFLKLILGKMYVIATDSQCVSCRKLLDTGFQFQFATVEKCLTNLYKKPL